MIQANRPNHLIALQQWMEINLLLKTCSLSMTWTIQTLQMMNIMLQGTEEKKNIFHLVLVLGLAAQMAVYALLRSQSSSLLSPELATGAFNLWIQRQ
ncbi:unnamed protein product [Linum trigynum]|uniref:Uncharacterized protein n=1 Tax=Linum trigynum TaxID=586398 RepID=A0AAV2DB06_9ROSI